MNLKEKFAEFLNDEVGSADHGSLLRWGALAVGSTVATLMIEAQVDASTKVNCGSNGAKCPEGQGCCSGYGPLDSWCSVGC